MQYPIRTRAGMLAAVALAAAAAAPASAQTLPPAQQVVERYIEAVGGRDAFRQHDYRRSEMEMAEAVNLARDAGRKYIKVASQELFGH